MSSRGSLVLVAALVALALVPAVGGQGGPPPTDSWPTWSPDGLRVSFTRSRNGVNDAFVADRSGSSVVRVGRAVWWSPDGSRMAIASGRGLAVANADGSSRRPVTRSGKQPAWSPDGGRLLFADGSSLRLYELGSRLLRTLETGVGSCDSCVVNVGWPQWSPDGRSIAYFRAIGLFNPGGILYVLDPARPPARAVRTIEGVEWSVPDWSPDGQWIAFHGVLSAGDAENTMRLAVVRADGTEAHTYPRADSFAWAPRGHTLAALEVGPRQATSLVIRRLDGGAARRLGPARSFDWSPAGERIAFERRSEVFVAGARGGARKLLAGREPRWSRNGRLLAFERPPFVDVAAADGRRQHRLARGGDSRWSPVDDVVAYVVEGCSKRAGIHVVDVRTGRDRQLTRPCSR